MTVDPIRKKHELKNYDFCYGMKANWVDMDTGKMYHIQEYREAIDRGEHPKGIRVTKWGNENETLEYVGEYTVRERMKDPEPDPKY